MKSSSILALTLALASLSLPACQRMHAEENEQGHDAPRKIVVTTPAAKDVVITQPYVCQIRSRRHIEVKALQEGYLEAISVKEGQSVKEGDVLFKVIPALYKAKYDAEVAEAEFARVEFVNTKILHEKGVVSPQEVKLYEAKLARAEAKAKLALAELGFTEVKAQFDGIIDRLYQMQGSLVGKGDLLTTLSDNDLMWVYFNVPEARYLEYKAAQGKNRENPQQLTLPDSHIQLVLANGNKFDHDAGDTVTVEGQFNNETGNIQFRADFPNPDHLLRHGQTGTVLIHRPMKNAVVIPQRATFEVLDKLYVYVVGEDHVAHRRPITIRHELEDIFVIESGLELKDKIILEGVRQVHDGEKVEYEFQKPEEALKHQKYHAE
jgi:membrane fusion protein (multidrug efflux system)